ncbi:AAA family ATPase [Pyrobaculum neutrophilum]|uniref:ATPase associated with various cellular activities AAA_5 n=1 Tax=Pyrobaculum neutrophilum (strain DSM 2338 / JCM 9278 / NBRC 100436 / V24Sta) TaxID=444157 RepID=B1Y999_PYRNV|nr:MoxR family ATPase [Pyrobaculum neutrophilum]ACB40328.1 ATPase associated with various cellular activities AAA_5 [Pyrobaculum neutrophilum V24Sta]
MRLSELLQRRAVDIPKLVRDRVRQLGVEEIRSRVSRVLRGLDDVVLDVLSGLMIGRPVVLVGTVGLGKTTLAETIAEILALGEPPYVTVACHSHMTAVDLTGDIDIAVVLQAGFDHPLSYIPGPLVLAHGTVLIMDELNRLNPYAQAALLQAIQEHYIYVRGYRIRADFALIGTANPSEYEGVYDLSEALADRLKFVEVKTPDVDLLKSILLWKAKEAVGDLGAEIPPKLAEILAKFAQAAEKAGYPQSVRSLSYALADATAQAWAQRRDPTLRDLKRALLANTPYGPEDKKAVVELFDRAIHGAG